MALENNRAHFNFSARDLSGVIWITGYSGAGKTTVSRILANQLQERGASVVLLDGDDLRDIFGKKWGYDRESRIELGYVNHKLCKHIAGQGHTVIIAAVGMYSEVIEWVRTNIPNFFQVYLNVSEEERRNRDAVTKNVYQRLGDLRSLYDEPETPDLVINNSNSQSAEMSATAILNYFFSKRTT
jgi:adenylylsulfate kinase-like enzyme